MKRPSDDLWELIQSMSPAEKRYFRLQAQAGARQEQNYLLLYDAIEAQREAYDETAVRAQFPDKGFQRQFSFTKTYLYNQLLRGLEQFHQEHSPELKLNAMLSHVQVLFERRLYDQARKQVNRAQKLARRYEYYPALLALLAWEMELDAIDHPNRTFEENQAASRTAAENHLNYLRLRALSLVHNRCLSDGVCDIAEKTSLEHLLDEAGRQAEEGNSFKARSLQLEMAALHAENVSEKLPEAQAHWQQLAELYDSEPKRLEQSPIRYLSSLEQLADTAIRNNDFPAAGSAIQCFSELAGEKRFRSRRMTREITQRQAWLQLALPLRQHDWAGAQAISSQLPGQAEAGEFEPPFRFKYGLMQALTAFAREDTAAADRWLRFLQEDPELISQPLCAAQAECLNVLSAGWQNDPQRFQQCLDRLGEARLANPQLERLREVVQDARKQLLNGEASPVSHALRGALRAKSLPLGPYFDLHAWLKDNAAEG